MYDDWDDDDWDDWSDDEYLDPADFDFSDLLEQDISEESFHAPTSEEQLALVSHSNSSGEAEEYHFNDRDNADAYHFQTTALGMQPTPQWLPNPFPYQTSISMAYHQSYQYQRWWSNYQQSWYQYQQWCHQQWLNQQKSLENARWTVNNTEQIAQQLSNAAGLECPPIEHINDLNESSPAIYETRCSWLTHLFEKHDNKLVINDAVFQQYAGQHGLGAYWVVGHELGHYYDTHHPEMLPFTSPERNADYFAGVLFRLKNLNKDAIHSLFLNHDLFPGSNAHLPGTERWKDFENGYSNAYVIWTNIFKKK